MRWERPKMHSQYMREMQGPRCVACPTFSKHRSTMWHFAQAGQRYAPPAVAQQMVRVLSRFSGRLRVSLMGSDGLEWPLSSVAPRVRVR
jgi:hypothetical protein